MNESLLISIFENRFFTYSCTYYRCVIVTEETTTVETTTVTKKPRTTIAAGISLMSLY